MVKRKKQHKKGDGGALSPSQQFTSQFCRKRFQVSHSLLPSPTRDTNSTHKASQKRLEGKEKQQER